MFFFSSVAFSSPWGRQLKYLIQSGTVLTNILNFVPILLDSDIHKSGFQMSLTVYGKALESQQYVMCLVPQRTKHVIF